MILGVGSDLVDIKRIERSLARFGERFQARIFTQIERAKAESRAIPRVRAATYAKRFAAKEACAKALGTGFRDGVFWRDMAVVNLPGGRPTLVLTGGAAERLRSLTPPGMRAEVSLSMTDDYPLAQAIVVISAIPDNLQAP
ncbi:MAG: holo-ACP synthase [Rhodospirillales bacterium]|nr:holo-ACP synthase [Rhodospirillales bacterium]